ncbi:glycosyltransferase family 39 protein [Lysobacter korlensis]|uniref:Glycosyltransferase family 39 protein n=1 Tax=Lysobacter korlensis TaxID=553636 RepID=A0ABV6RXU0_9GAMM
MPGSTPIIAPTGAPNPVADTLPRFAAVPVLSAAFAQLIVLAATANLYGYHRDELYFRMLPPAAGYVDQPPLTPAVARFFSTVVADEAWAIRIPAMVFAAASVLVVALIAREVGGGRFAQGLAAWGYAFAAFPLIFGHVLLTASLDLLVWPAVVLTVIRAVLRNRPRWWLVAGLIVGVSMYNKLLIALLLVSIVVGILAVGPRRILASWWPYAGAAIAVVIGTPNLVYQWTNGWPQLAMGRALAENNADEVRILMWPLLLLLLGPLLVPTWVAGIVALVRRQEWRPIRFLVAALPVLLLLTFAGGSQFYYPLGLLACLYAIGCVPVTEWAQARFRRRGVVLGAVGVNALVSAVISLPVIPLSALGATPIPAINQVTADQIGWPEYVAQVEAVLEQADLPAENTVILATNYGEAGALDRYGSAALPAVVSGHNALAELDRPGADVSTVVLVGYQVRHLAQEFETCEQVTTLDNALGVENEEQGAPISICRGPLEAWSQLWDRIGHFD